MKLLLITLGVVAAAIVLRHLYGNWKIALRVSGGWFFFEMWNILYDGPFWIFMQDRFGPTLGSVYCTIGALFLNFAMLVVYQRMKIDWLGVEVVEKYKSKLKVWNDFTAFIFLSVVLDSFVCTAFLRHGRFGKLDKKDYIIFVSSTIISCTVWSVLISLTVEAFKAVWVVVD